MSRKSLLVAILGATLSCTFAVNSDSAEACGIKLAVKAVKVKRTTKSTSTRRIVRSSTSRKPIRTRVVAKPTNTKSRRPTPVRVARADTTRKPVARSVAPVAKPAAVAARKPDTKPVTAKVDVTARTPVATTPPVTKVAKRPTAKPVEVPRATTAKLSKRLYFGTGSASVRQNRNLEAVVKYLKANPSAKLRIVGYTDSVGSSSLNLRLSEQRAQAVADHLSAAGLDSSRFEVKGRGEAAPIASNGSARGRSRNRRVELKLK